MWNQRRLGFALLAAMSWSGPAAGLTVDVAFTASRFFPLDLGDSPYERPPVMEVSGAFRVTADSAGAPGELVEVVTQPETIDLAIAGVSYAPADVGVYLAFRDHAPVQITAGQGDPFVATAGDDVDWVLSVDFDDAGSSGRASDGTVFAYPGKSFFFAHDLHITVVVDGGTPFEIVKSVPGPGNGIGEGESPLGPYLCRRTRPTGKFCAFGDRLGERCTRNEECGLELPFALPVPLPDACVVPAPFPSATVDDVFTRESTVARVGRGTTLCAPVGLELPGAAEPAALLRGFAIREAASDADDPFRTFGKLTVSTEFGTLTLGTKKPNRLLLPAVASEDRTTPLPDTAAVDAFRCAPVTPMAKSPRFRRIRNVAAGNGKTYDLKRPSRLCLVSRTGDYPVLYPYDALLCYPARPAVGQPEARTITGLWLIHALGVEPADVLAKEELCVPAEVTS